VRHFPDEDVPLGAGQFLAVALLGAAPWILPAAAAVARLVRRRAWRELDELPWVALALWALAVLGLTALSPFRLPHYGLPAYPAVALLAAREWLTAPRRGLVVAHALGFAGLAAACAAAGAGGGEAFARHVLHVTDVATRKAAAAGLALAPPPWEMIQPLLAVTALLAAAAAVGLGGLALARRYAGAPAVVLAAALALLPGVGAGLAIVSAHRAVRPLALHVAGRAGAPDLLVHEGPLENSGALEWYAGRRPVIVDGRRSVLAFGATLDGASDSLWETERLRAAWQSGRRVWVVTVRSAERSLTAQLPGARLVAAAGGRRLYVNRL
jgi:hypothetical protein